MSKIIYIHIYSSFEYIFFFSVAVKHISAAVKRLETNPTSDDSNLSILEKLLKIDYQVAIIMALDMFFAGIDTVSKRSQ